MQESYIKILKGITVEGEKITVEFEGKEYTRRLKFRRDCGLYITINGIEHYEYEMV